jgi:hypothetical protein
MAKNKKVYSKFKSPDILNMIKVGSLKWLGNVVRMDGTWRVRKLLEGKPGGKRKKR